MIFFGVIVGFDFFLFCDLVLGKCVGVGVVGYYSYG